MKKVLILTEQKYFDALLNHSPIINGKCVHDLKYNELKPFLEPYGLKFISKETIDSYNISEYDIVIIDDLKLYNEDNKHIVYYFIPPIDFNISDPSISDRFPQIFKTPHSYNTNVEWCNDFYPNLKFLSSTVLHSANNIFDISLVLNLNNHSELWGKYHYVARELFKSIKRKKFRLDYCFREVKKENRVKFFVELIDSLSDEKLKNIKLSAHGNFLIDETLNLDIKRFFESQNELSTFLEFEKLDRLFFSFDELENPIPGYNSWATNKLFNNTFSSDISIYFESGREVSGIINTMNNMITEKTFDLLVIGKPFIYMSSNVGKFLEQYKFKDYNKLIFDNINEDKILLVNKILNMSNFNFEQLLSQINHLVDYNTKLTDKYYKNNTFLYNLFHN